MTMFAELRRTVDHHRSSLTDAKLREMSGVSTYVKRSAEKLDRARTVLVHTATMYPIPAELPDAFWEPLRETHYVYVPRDPEGGEDWPFVLRLMEAHLHMGRDPGAKKVAGPRALAVKLLSSWLVSHGAEVTDSKVRRALAQHAMPESMEEEDAQFLAVAALAAAASGTDWILWDPFRARVISLCLDPASEPMPTRWFLRDEDGRVGLVVPFDNHSPTWHGDYAHEDREAGRQRWWADWTELLRLNKLSAADLKAQWGASGRTKKADLLQEWFERPRWDHLYPPREVGAAVSD